MDNEASKELNDLTKKMQQTTDHEARLKLVYLLLLHSQEKELIYECFDAGLLQNVSPGVTDLLTKKKLNFSFYISDPASPYNGIQIKGYAKIDSSYPNGHAPYIYFNPILPHINVYRDGMHCTLTKWNGKESNLKDSTFDQFINYSNIESKGYSI